MSKGSKDIRSFFTVISKKPTEKAPLRTTRKVLSSDDDDCVEATPGKRQPKKPTHKRRAQVLSSDSEEESKPKKELSVNSKPYEESKLKPVSISDVFSNVPIKQSKIEHVPKPEISNEVEKKEKKKKPKKNSEAAVHADEDFEKTLFELDDSFLVDNLDVIDKTINDAVEKEKYNHAEPPNIEEKRNDSVKDVEDKVGKEPTKSETKQNDVSKKPRHDKTDPFKERHRKASEQHKEDPKDNRVEKEQTKSGMKQNDGDKEAKHDKTEPVKKRHRQAPERAEDPKDNRVEKEPTKTEKKENDADKETKHDKTEPVKKRHRKGSEHTEETPVKKQKLDRVDSGIDADQEKFEKKRYSAILYQKYLHRGGPKHHGAKEIPKGKPDCLKNLTFLRTGVLDSLESDEFENLIKDHGGRVVHGISKKVNYVVVGDDPGPSKLQKAQSYNIPEISEDDLLDIILTKSGMKPRFSKKPSEDDGVASGSDYSPKKSKHHNNSDQDEKIRNDTTQKVKEVSPKSKSPKFSHSTHSKEDHKVSKNVNADTQEKGGGEKNKGDDDDDMRPSKTHFKEVMEKCLEKKVKVLDNKSGKMKQSQSTITSSRSEDLPLITRGITKTPDSSQMWTEKYKPTSIKAIIGQQEPNSNMNKLKKWLQNWSHNQKPEIKKKLPRPSPWNQYDGAYFKCALLSGSPGVGKTTTATLVAKELGFDVVEFNASDTRNKKLLHEQVSQLLSTTTIAGYAAGEEKTKKRRVLLMDEVDGMAGNEDRGGIQELISLIKSTKIPIVCMCNDRNHQKMRTLVTYCYDLKFAKPSLQQIRGAMMSICFKEGLNLKPDAVGELINGTGCDIRQTLNHLSMWSADEKNLSLETVTKESKSSQKDVVLGPWEVVKKVFSESEQKNMRLADKFKLFFFDYSFGPLFIQENYLNVSLNCSEKEKLLRASQAANSLSRGDLIESKIRGSNNWALLETQAFFYSVLPGHYMAGTLKSANFPSWLGKNSKKNKLNRMLSELHAHTKNCTSGSKLAIKLDYLKPLRDAIVTPLKTEGMAGIPKALGIMKAYNLLREDLNNLVELCQWKNTKNPFNDVESKVKSAFTRAYNKEVPMLPFSTNSGVSKKKASALMEEDDLLGEDTVESDNDDNDNIDLDAMIKKKTAKDKMKKDTSKASSSKTKEPKGKGRKK